MMGLWNSLRDSKVIQSEDLTHRWFLVGSGAYTFRHALDDGARMARRTGPMYLAN